MATMTSPLKLSDCIAMVDAKHHFKNLANVNDLYYQQRFNSSDSEDVTNRTTISGNC